MVDTTHYTWHTRQCSWAGAGIETECALSILISETSLPHCLARQTASVSQEKPPLDCIKLPGLHTQSCCLKGRKSTNLSSGNGSATWGCSKDNNDCQLHATAIACLAGGIVWRGCRQIPVGLKSLPIHLSQQTKKGCKVTLGWWPLWVSKLTRLMGSSSQHSRCVYFNKDFVKEKETFKESLTLHHCESRLKSKLLTDTSKQRISKSPAWRSAFCALCTRCLSTAPRAKEKADLDAFF